MYGTNGGLMGELTSWLGALNLLAGSISLELLDKKSLLPAISSGFGRKPCEPTKISIVLCYLLFRFIFIFHGHSVLYYLLPNVLFSCFF